MARRRASDANSNSAIRIAFTASRFPEMAYNRALHMGRRRELAGQWADVLIVDLQSANDLPDGQARGSLHTGTSESRRIRRPHIHWSIEQGLMSNNGEPRTRRMINDTLNPECGSAAA